MTNRHKPRHPPCHRGGLRWHAAAVAVMLLAGCADYEPPVVGDQTSETYRTDLEKCRSASTEAVRLKNADNPGSWVISPFTGPPAVRAAIRTCLVGKGYEMAPAGG
jgi:hypothetical protein